MLLYTNEENIARELVDRYAGEMTLSMYEIEDYVKCNYPHEEEVDSNDINNIRYEFMHLAEERSRDNNNYDDSDYDNNNYDDSDYDNNNYNDSDYDDNNESSCSYSSGSSYRYRRNGSSKRYGGYYRKRYKSKFEVEESILRRVICWGLGLFITFQFVIMVTDSSWGDFFDELLEPGRIIKDVISLVIFCQIGLLIGGILQVIYEKLLGEYFIMRYCGIGIISFLLANFFLMLWSEKNFGEYVNDIFYDGIISGLFSLLCIGLGSIIICGALFFLTKKVIPKVGDVLRWLLCYSVSKIWVVLWLFAVVFLSFTIPHVYRIYFNFEGSGHAYLDYLQSGGESMLILNLLYPTGIASLIIFLLLMPITRRVIDFTK